MQIETPKEEALEELLPGAPAEEGSAAADGMPAAPAPVDVTAEIAAETAAEPASAAAPNQPADLPPATVATMLAERFPALFAPGKPLPIKLRIQADIQLRAPGLFNRKSLSIFLHRHTTSTPYLKALVASPTRHDLDGTAAGEVAQEHRDAAAVEVQRRRAIVEERIAAERAARRGPRPQRPPPGPASHAARPAEGPERPEHPGQAEQPARRSPHPAGERNARFARPGRPTAGGRPASAPGASPAQQPRQPHHQPQHQPQHRPQHRPHHQPQHQPQHQPRPERTGSEGEALLPMPDLPPAELAARRERALLLRQFESSPLTRANFCALKRIGEAELDAQLALARQEAAPRKRG